MYLFYFFPVRLTTFDPEYNLRYSLLPYYVLFLLCLLPPKYKPTRSGPFLNPRSPEQHPAHSRCSIHAGSVSGQFLLPIKSPTNLSPFQRVTDSTLSKHCSLALGQAKEKDQEPTLSTMNFPQISGPHGSPEPGRQGFYKMLSPGLHSGGMSSPRPLCSLHSDSYLPDVQTLLCSSGQVAAPL